MKDLPNNTIKLLPVIDHVIALEFVIGGSQDKREAR
jgi:hypothetical protein